MNKASRFLSAAVLVAMALAPAATGDASTVAWTSPTPPDQSRFGVPAAATVRFSLAAATATPGAVVHIAPARALPAGAVFTAVDGAAATAAFSWRPSRAGDYSVQFTATETGSAAAAPTLTYFIHVASNAKRPPKPTYPRSYRLTDDRVAHWTPVLRRAVVRAQPRVSARAVTTLDTWTTDDTQNIVLVLERRDLSSTQTWYRVRLPILPNNSTGWVQARSVGALYTVHTHLYVNRKTFRATLKHDGRVVFTSIVGVGKSFWPTPRGEFYVRDKLTGFDNPAYGPIAFGTSARSPVLTDWPGGGFIGVHGTDEPQILPGRVSHGCIRLPNASILKLARLMPVGTPLTIS